MVILRTAAATLVIGLLSVEARSQEPVALSPLMLAQEADACDGFLVGSARYAADFMSLVVTCTTTPATAATASTAESPMAVGDAATFDPLIGNLAPARPAPIAAKAVSIFLGAMDDS